MEKTVFVTQHKIRAGTTMIWINKAKRRYHSPCQCKPHEQMSGVIEVTA